MSGLARDTANRRSIHPLGAAYRTRGLLHRVRHAIAQASRRYYFEDYGRVYPNGIAYGRLGRRRHVRELDRDIVRELELRNFLNHRKFYDFAAQFVEGKRAVDAGCGSGYGCKILADAGASHVHAFDASRHSLRFARKRFGEHASFTRQTITALDQYQDEFADVVVCSEVLEHVKEYGLEARALDELRRITKPRGLLVLGTPNSELLGDHGFTWDELSDLVRRRFDEVCVFENALLPFDPVARRAWEGRVASGQTGVVISERIVLAETVLPADGAIELKRGLEAGEIEFGGRSVDTTRLHNTHSWVVLAVRE